MTYKRILGLDLGSSSIGWAIVLLDEFGNLIEIIDMGVRIIPIDGKRLGEYQKGNNISKTKERREKRGPRRNLARFRLRRDNLKKVFKAINLVPKGVNADFLEITNRKEQKNQNKTEEYKPYELFELRFNALSQKIELEDLAWVWYQLLGRRGFKSNRKGNPEEKQKPDSVVITGKLISAFESDETFKTKNGQIPYWKINVEIDDKIEQYETRKQKYKSFEGQTFEFEVKKPRQKEGLPTIEILQQNETNWAAKKKSIEAELEEGNLTPGAYYFKKYKKSKKKKTHWKVRDNVIDRKYIIDEFDKIWAEQAKYHAILSDHAAYLKVLKAVLPKNNQNAFDFWSEKSLQEFVRDYVIFYHRPITFAASGHCELEAWYYVDKKTKKLVKQPLKVCPAHHPVFDEFRILKQVHNLRVQPKKRAKGIPISLAQKQKIYEELQKKAELSDKQVSKLLKLEGDEKIIMTDKLVGAKTKSTFRKILKKTGYSNAESLLNDPFLLDLLWHKVHSLDAEGLQSAVEKPITQWTSDWKKRENSYETAKKLPNFTNELVKELVQVDLGTGTASYSKKALRKLSTLMALKPKIREIDTQTKDRFNELKSATITEELKKEFEGKTLERLQTYDTVQDLFGLQEHDAKALIYGEVSDVETYKSPDEIKKLPPHSLRQPLVESIANETLLLVKDIWEKYDGNKPTEVRIEMARDLKNSGAERNKITDLIRKNTAINITIEKRVREIFESKDNPPSNSDYTRYKLWMETRVNADKDDFKKLPKSLIERYRLWEEAEHKSPYTGKVIPLAKLFTKEYDIEHIIPRARMFTNSRNNLTICELVFNKAKGKMTAYDFMKQGSTIKGVSTLPFEDYKKHVESIFPLAKQRYFLMSAEEIPDDFVERQLHETRYIGKKVSQELEKVFGKYKVKTSSGRVTDYLREKWGLNDVMKKLQLPRYEQLEIKGEFDKGQLFSRDKKHSNRLRLAEYSKRNDHRHHAIDALIAACTTQKIVTQLNNLNKIAQGKAQRLDKTGKYLYEFNPPCDNFVELAEQQLKHLVVSLRNEEKLAQPTRQTHKKRDKSGKEIQVWKPYEERKNAWAVRGSLHKDTNFGKKKYDGTERFVARKKILALTTLNLVDNIADHKLRHDIIVNLLKIPSEFAVMSGKKFKQAATEYLKSKGIEKLTEILTDENLAIFNKGRKIPVFKTRVLADGDANVVTGKIPLRGMSDKNNVEKGENYCSFVFEHSKTGKRTVATISLFDAVRNKIERTLDEETQKLMNDGFVPIFQLFKKDTVYLMYPNEFEGDIDWADHEALFPRLFTVVKMSGNVIYFSNLHYSNEIELDKDKYYTDKNVQEYIASQNGIQIFKPLNSEGDPIEETKIWERLIKVKINRLGDKITPEYYEIET